MRISKSELDAMLKRNPSIKVEQVWETGCAIPYSSGITFKDGVANIDKGLRFTIPGTPVPAPRQTQRDKWMKRPCVMRYREYADRLRKFIDLHDMYVGKITMKFYMPMPDSWSLKKKLLMAGKPHRVKPDGDNLCKAVQDALLKNDSMVWACYYEKRWSVETFERTELSFETTE